MFAYVLMHYVSNLRYLIYLTIFFTNLKFFVISFSHFLSPFKLLTLSFSSFHSLLFSFIYITSLLHLPCY
jgi:hypothetical protein